jgi:hypothetical protein
MELNSLKIKVDKYIAILENTSNYRKDWSENLKGMITSTLEQIIKETGIKATLDVQDDIENLEVLILNLGQEVSGISEKIPNSTYKKPFIKNQGALIYQQLFNGKVMIMIAYPVIEGYGQPKPPKMVEILRPEEFKQTYIIRHVEQFMKEIIDWEDYDDDIHEHMASSPIGFQAQNLISEEPTS